MATLQATTAQNRTEPVTITDMFKIKPLEYNLTKDGTKVALL
jgi:hypothetical protein